MMDIHRCRFVDYTPHTITSLAFNHPSTTDFVPVDLRLAVGRSNGDIEIWNPRFSWVHEQTLRGGQGRSVEGLCWGRWDNNKGGISILFSIGGSTVVTEWNLETGTPLKNYDCNTSIVWSLSISANGECLAVGCDDGTVVLIDITGGPGVMEHLTVLQRQEARVLSLTWNGNEQVIGGCSDGKIRVWSVSNTNTESNNNGGEYTRGRIIATMKVDKSKHETTLVWSVLVVNNGKQLVSGDSTGSFKFWDLAFFALQQTFQVHEADVLCLASDYTGDTIFSGSVDRKIVSFQTVGEFSKKRKLKKWASFSNRLVHSHDVRAMTAFESKGANFLISGGVEKNIVVNSIKYFSDGLFRKIPITLHVPCVFTSPETRYIVMYQDQVVKIWRLNKSNAEGTGEEESGKKLIAKLNISDEENVTSVTLSPSGDVLAVATNAMTKLFHLLPIKDGKALKVTKLQSPLLESQGARIVKFDKSGNKLYLVSPENELFIYLMDDTGIRKLEVEGENENDDEYVTEKEPYTVHLVSPKVKSPLPHFKNINHLIISKDNEYFAISRLCGTVDIFKIDEIKFSITTKFLCSIPALACYPSSISFTSRNTLLVVTSENNLFEFEVINNKTNRASLTPWSKRNSDNLPRELVSIFDKCCGISTTNDINDKSERVWLWGSNWLSFIDLSVDLPLLQSKTNTRKRDRLGMEVKQTTNKDAIYGGDDDYDMDVDIDGYNPLNKAINRAKYERVKASREEEESLTIDKSNKSKTTSNEGGDDYVKSTPFWLTLKYRPILCADLIGDSEMVIVERPQFYITLPPAFKSHHKIRI